MSDIAVSIHGLGKQYRLGAMPQAYGTLRDSLAGLLKKSASGGGRRETFWALRDVSFDVPRGQVLGIIGANGAGKSTLLKILSRVTEPTEGEIRFRGRVSSLLEVGTGFHPELTGRENIYLSGQVLGMDRRDVTRKFDEIVAFAGVDKFIDTPLKRFSSGMNVRLGFAVAAHLDPEILVVDEVLAVGDAEFQRKCISRMKDVSQEGRTVFFVSHNMDAINRLCHRSILLERGSVSHDGSSEQCIRAYLSKPQVPNVRGTSSGGARHGIVSVNVHQGGLEAEAAVLDTEKETGFSLVLESDQTEDVNVTICITNINGSHVTESSFADYFGRYLTQRPKNSLEISLPKSFLQPGDYYCTIWLDNRFGQSIDRYRSQILKFRSFGSRSQTGSGRKPPRGSVQPPFLWADGQFENSSGV